jgi:hypothetical protein
MELFLNLMGRSLLIRDRKLVSSNCFMGRVDVVFSGLEAERRLSKNGIRSGSLSGVFILVF